MLVFSVLHLLLSPCQFFHSLICAQEQEQQQEQEEEQDSSLAAFIGETAKVSIGMRSQYSRYTGTCHILLAQVPNQLTRSFSARASC